MMTSENNDLPGLTDCERARYEWQLWTPGFGEAGQRKLKQASVLISRVGGVGGTVACYLAAAGIGRLILAHRGSIRPSDLNRQLLMTTPALGTSRISSAISRLHELNPHVEVLGVEENVSADNADELVSQADLVITAAPRFEERLSLNRAAVRQRKPLVDAAMYDLTAQLHVMLPGRTACLDCLYPEFPEQWRREFPVIGAVAGSVATLAAMEAIKLLTGLGEPLAGRLLLMDLSRMEFRQIATLRRAQCPTCGQLAVG